jgi:HEAT repeats
VDEVDLLISEAGQTHVIPPREDPVLLERLRDPRVLDRARSRPGASDRKARTTAILCLERIGYVLHDQETADLLLQHAATAQDKFEVMTTLDALHKCQPPRPLAAGPLVALARRREWQVWQPAIRCLHLADPTDVEQALLERVGADQHGRVYVAFELRYMSSRASLDALERLVRDPTVDVRCVALDLLGERLGHDVVPFARALAGHSQQAAKWWAEKWLAQYGDAEDVPFMVSRLKRLLSGRTTTFVPPEASYVIPFLLKHQDIPQVARALASLRERSDRLPTNERAWIESQTSLLG